MRKDDRKLRCHRQHARGVYSADAIGWLRSRSACAGGLLLLLLLTLPAAVEAGDFTYATNNGAITITGYTGPGGDVTIPDSVFGLPVTSIGVNAFNYRLLRN